MKAIKIYEYGRTEVLRYEETPSPKAGPNEVLLKVHASSINPVDTGLVGGYLTRMYNLQLPMTPGFDVAGVITQVGEGVTNFKVGDYIYGQASVMGGGSGAYAEYARTPVNCIAKMPENTSFIESACLALTGVSAYEALYKNINLQAGQHILIHGGSGGIGTMAIQLAKYIGAYVATTVSTQNIQYAKQLGADEVIDYKSEEFDKLLTNYDAVYDTIGGDTYIRSFNVLKRGGILVSMREQPNIEHMEKYSVKSIYQHTQVTTQNLEALTKLVENKALKIYIEKVYPIENLKEAFNAKTNGHIRGKLAIEIR
ncbi:MAG: NADP-dependent oxidoreductase [Bacteroidota bacterium]|nr:NADP-dependent oxidoreductase [Bacteroidota bacterium]